MAFIVQANTTCPEQMVSQKDFTKFLRKIWPEQGELIDQSSELSGVENRYFTLPLNYYRDLVDIGKRNIIWKAEAVRLQKKNIKQLLEKSEIDISEIGLIVSATSTGLAVPSLEALMMNEFTFSKNTIRLPIFGLGCLAGVAGLNRITEYLRANPKSAAILMVTELCSLTFHFDEWSEAYLGTANLFGDGSGVVLLVGKDHPMAKKSQFEIIASESIFYPETEKMMGLEMIENGYQFICANEISLLMKSKLSSMITKFLSKNKLVVEDLHYYFVHPGDPKLLLAINDSLNCSQDKLALSWNSLKSRGNTSAASIVHILEQAIDTGDIAPKTLGLMIAIGPGLSVELSLISACKNNN